MLRATRFLILFFLSITAMIGIRALNLHVLLTILLVIPVTILTLFSILSFLIGKVPETTEPKYRGRLKDGQALIVVPVHILADARKSPLWCQTGPRLSSAKLGTINASTVCASMGLLCLYVSPIKSSN